MTREEEIIESAKRKYSPSSGIPQSLSMRVGFIEGAKWADETMITKACEWLEKQQDNYNLTDAWNGDFISFVSFMMDFRKAMKEE